MLSAGEGAIKLAGELLRAGQPVAIPTETVYGLAANAFDPDAVKKVFEAKGRPQDNPLIVHVSDVCQVEQLVSCFPEKARILAEKFWPGPLTMIMPKSEKIPDAVTCGLDTVAIRFPSHETARAIIDSAGVPLAAPSANRSGSPSPTTAQHVLDDMDGRIALIIDDGSCDVGVESTVITLAGEIPVLLRPGAVTPKQLSEAIGEIEISPAVLSQLPEGERPASPGMKYKHYAPKAQVVIVEGDLDAFNSYASRNAAEGDYILGFENEKDSYPLPVVTYGTGDDPLSQSRRLFDALRELDDKGAVNVFARCPDAEGVGLAVLNRLLRAAAFKHIKL